MPLSFTNLHRIHKCHASNRVVYLFKQVKKKKRSVFLPEQLHSTIEGSIQHMLIINHSCQVEGVEICGWRIDPNWSVRENFCQSTFKFVLVIVKYCLHIPKKIYTGDSGEFKFQGIMKKLNKNVNLTQLMVVVMQGF